jgi:hypothetical protein
VPLDAPATPEAILMAVQEMMREREVPPLTREKALSAAR